MRAVIFANGMIDIPPQVNAEIITSELVIAADGGLKNCLLLGIQPHVIIGDLDSMQSGEIAKFTLQGVKVIRYPTRKDETDLELALHYVVNENCHDVTILGSLGSRWDMTIANILLAANPAFSSLHIQILDGFQELTLLTSGTNVIPGKPGITISLIPLEGDVSGITTQGLEYPLVDEDLQFGATRGISNIFTMDNAEVTFRKGLLLCVVNRSVHN